MSNVENIYPANDFKVVANNAAATIKVGVIMGYDEDGKMVIFGGGLLNGKQPVSKDWLWMIETVKTKLINGDYNPEEQ